MNTYRSHSTIDAVQYTGVAIEGITCGGSDAEFAARGCDPSRRKHTHVHTAATGGITVLQPGDWIYPIPGGPWGVAGDQKFRGHWEVPSIVEDLKAIDDILAEPEAPEVVPTPEVAPLQIEPLVDQIVREVSPSLFSEDNAN